MSDPPPPPRRWRAMLLIATAVFLPMSLWFSVTAVAPDLAVTWDLSPSETGWLTTAVQLGFVAGALLSAVFTLSDTIRPRDLFAGSAVLAAIATVAIAATVDSLLPAVGLRFQTGMALAGVYPPGMKMIAGWFRAGRGFAIGVLVGAIAVGSALPHLLRAVGGGVDQPRLVLFQVSALAVVGGLLVLRIDEGPYQAPAAPFDPRAVDRILRDRGTLLANVGYFGHMFELFAVWTWLPVYLIASFRAAGMTGTTPLRLAGLVTFGSIAFGGAGAIVAGFLADRWGRSAVTCVSLVGSGLCCLAAGPLFGAPLALLVPFCLLWGFLVVADSAQFSACVTELAEASYVGTALTLQTALGFLLTAVTIQFVPIVQELVGWQWAFAPLVIGPAAGTSAMLYLRALPEANRLAGGRR